MPLDTEKCEITETVTTDDAGERLKKFEHYPIAWRCREHARRFVYVFYSDQRE